MVIKGQICYISAYLDIGRSTWEKNTRRTFDEYMEDFMPYISLMSKSDGNIHCMIVYIDEKYYETLKNKISTLLPIKLIPINEEFMKKNTIYSKIEKETEILNSVSYKTRFKTRLNSPENNNPKYTLINHSKIDFVVNAMLLEKSEYFCWCDFGYFKNFVNKNVNLLDYKKFNEEKITYTLINHLDDKDKDILYTMLNAPEKIGGFFFFGRRDILLKYQLLYHETHRWFQENELVDDDQHLVLLCYYKNPELFDLKFLGGWHRAFDAFQKTDTDVNKKCIDYTTPSRFCEIMGEAGSDKGKKDIQNSHHNYTLIYDELFLSSTDKKLRIFELGIGTNYTDIPSNMGEHGIPGASLRGWSKIFQNSFIYGADIDKRILFQESRIKTYFCDQTKPDIIKNMWNIQDLEENFDIIIEDGLHTFEANVIFFENSFYKVKYGGYYIIEDILNSDLIKFQEKIKIWNTKYPLASFDLRVITGVQNKTDNTLLIIRKM
jgi:hypothetical protein